MNKRIIIYILGWVLIVEGAAMQVCTVTSVIYREHEGLYFLPQRRDPQLPRRVL